MRRDSRISPFSIDDSHGYIDFTVLRPPSRPRSFHSILLDATRDHIVLADRAHPSQPLRLEGEEVMAGGYWMVWFLYKNMPWDIARFYRPDGLWTGYYVDVLEPVRWRNDDPATLETLVDLFLDVWITPRGKVIVLDEDEFEEAVAAGHLTLDQERHARGVLRNLLTSLADDTFPPSIVRNFAPQSKSEGSSEWR